jgi:hypothetical protein
VTDLRGLHRVWLSDGAVFGHAKDGNLHFRQSGVQHGPDIVTDDFMRAMVGSSAVNMTGHSKRAWHWALLRPFVETEWGGGPHTNMRPEIVVRPEHAQPGVVINPDKRHEPRQKHGCVAPMINASNADFAIEMSFAATDLNLL